MKIADIHIHSNLSDGVRAPESIVDFTEQLKVLDKIYITDHNSIEGSIRAKNYAISKLYKIDVGIGSEISSKDCHIVALDINKDIKKGMSVEKTAEEVLSQGGFPVIAHPYNPFFSVRHQRGGVLIKRLVAAKIPFAIEVNGTHNYTTILYKKGKLLNKKSSLALTNKKAINIANKYNIPIVGGSDAHMLRVIGSAYTVYQDNLVEDIKQRNISYGFNFSDRKSGLVYLSYHILFNPIPLDMRKKRKMLNILPKARDIRSVE